MTVSQNTHDSEAPTPGAAGRDPEPPQLGAGRSGDRPSPLPDRGWRWWFVALGPWAGVAVAVAAAFLGR